MFIKYILVLPTSSQKKSLSFSVTILDMSKIFIIADNSEHQFNHVCLRKKILAKQSTLFEKLCLF